MSKADNKLIAKNTVALTLRMALTIIVGLFTSRIVLSSLGVEGYGVYGVVAGLISLFKFVNVALAKATMRTFVVTLKLAADERAKVTASALRLHLTAAAITTVVATAVAMPVMTHLLDIPADSQHSAVILMWCLAAVLFMSILQIPFTSLILAREDMRAYSVIEAAYALLRAAVIATLLLVPGNKIEVFGLMSVFIALSSLVIYVTYCVRRYGISLSLRRRGGDYDRSITVLAQNDIYNSFAAHVRECGDPLIMNVFFGVVINTATTIVTTVLNSVTLLITTVTTAFQPQIIKSYADNDVPTMSTLARRATLFTLLGYAALAIPLMIATPDVFRLWLGTVPPYAVSFLRIVLAINVFYLINLVIGIMILATGQIRRFSLLSGLFYLMCPLLSYIALSQGLAPITVFVIEGTMYAMIAVTGLVILRRLVAAFSMRQFVASTLKGIAAIAVSAIAARLLASMITADTLPALVNIAVAVAATAAVFLPLASMTLTAAERASFRRHILATFKPSVSINE